MRFFAGLFGLITILQCWDLIQGNQTSVGSYIATIVALTMFLAFFFEMRREETLRERKKW